MGRPKGGTNTTHSKEEKLKLVKRMLNGESGVQLQKETGIYHSQIHKWTKQYLEGGEAALVNKRKPGNPLAKYERRKELTPTEQLEYKIALLERELLKKDGEIMRLKKVHRTRKGRCQKKVIQQIYAYIEKESVSHSVKELCDVYGVSRSGYYKWLKRKGTSNRYEQQQQELDYYVADVHSHYPSQGYRSIADTLLNEYGWVVSDISVLKSMQRLGIKGFVRKQKSPTPIGAEHNRFSNVLNRDFHSEKPMQKLVTDVTYIKNKGKWYYFACYLDLFNNEIVDWELSDVFDNLLVMKPAKRILEKAKSTGTPILLHSDQGVQYSSAGYCNLLKSYNTIQSMSRAGTPHDNAVMESFFGRFKDIMSSHFQYWKCDDIHKTVADTVYYFNYIRPVRKLKRKPPVQYRLELAA